MIREPRRHCRGDLLARIETEMRRTKIIDACPPHTCRWPRYTSAGPTIRPTRKRGQTLPKRRVKPLNRGRIDHAVSLRTTSERLDTSCRTVNHAAFNLNHRPALRAFDHVGDQDVSPRLKPRPVLPGPPSRDHGRPREWLGYRPASHRCRSRLADAGHSDAPVP